MSTWRQTSLAKASRNKKQKHKNFFFFKRQRRSNIQPRRWIMYQSCLTFVSSGLSYYLSLSVCLSRSLFLFSVVMVHLSTNKSTPKRASEPQTERSSSSRSRCNDVRFLRRSLSIAYPCCPNDKHTAYESSYSILISSITHHGQRHSGSVSPT